MKKILLFGNSGFIGRKLHEDLATLYPLEGFDSKTCNLLDKDRVNSCLSSYQEDLILIITSSIVRTVENSFDAYMKNILMIHHIIEAIKVSTHISHVIFLSSIDVYGIHDLSQPLHEETPIRPHDYYGMSKVTSEFMLKTFCQDASIPLAILRLPGVYGVNEEKSTIGALIKNAKLGLITLYDQGEAKRDFIFVNDMATVISIVIEKSFNGILNVSTGESYRLSHIVQLLQKYYPFAKVCHEVSQQANRQKEIIFNCTALQQLINPYKMTMLPDGISYILREKTCQV